MRRGQPLRRETPDAEDLVWLLLKGWNARGYHFRRREFYFSFHLDFVEHDIQLVIALRDGTPGAAARLSPDIARAHVLAEAGYTILEFWRAEVEADPERIAGTLAVVLEDRPPPHARADAGDPA